MDEEYTDEQIRDWYAGVALAGLMSPQSVPTPTLNAIAHIAFDIADAMMAEREERTPFIPKSEQINPS
jgi:hypothetical protein